MKIVFNKAGTSDTITRDIHRNCVAKLITAIRKLRRIKGSTSTTLVVPMWDENNDVHYPLVTIKHTGYISYTDNSTTYVYWM